MVRLPKESNTLWKDHAINQKKKKVVMFSVNLNLFGIFFRRKKVSPLQRTGKNLHDFLCTLFGSCHNPYIFNYFFNKICYFLVTEKIMWLKNNTMPYL